MFEATTSAPVNEVTRAAAADTATLSPRFYTTDFEAMDAMSVDRIRGEWDALMDEFKSDPNKGHFKRNEKFDGDWSEIESGFGGSKLAGVRWGCGWRRTARRCL